MLPRRRSPAQRETLRGFYLLLRRRRRVPSDSLGAARKALGDLAKEVYGRLLDLGSRCPSVFYVRDKIGARFRDDSADAVLQLGGGGVALIFLTRKSFRRKGCLAELRAFLSLKSLTMTLSGVMGLWNYVLFLLSPTLSL